MAALATLDVSLYDLSSLRMFFVHDIVGCFTTHTFPFTFLFFHMSLSVVLGGDYLNINLNKIKLPIQPTTNQLNLDRVLMAHARFNTKNIATSISISNLLLMSAVVVINQPVILTSV